MSLDTLLRQTKSILRNTALSTLLYFSPLQANAETIPLNEKQGTSWNKSVPVESFDQKGNLNGLVAQAVRRKTQTTLYFQGRPSGDNYEFEYSTTNSSDPRQDVPEINPDKTKLYLFAPEGTEIRQIKQTAAVYLDGKITLVEAKSLENSSHPTRRVFSIARDMVENLRKAEKEAISSKTMNMFKSGGPLNEFLTWLEEAPPARAKNAVEGQIEPLYIMYKIPLWTLPVDRNAPKGKEVGRQIIFAINSPHANSDGQIPRLALYQGISFGNFGETASGSLETIAHLSAPANELIPITSSESSVAQENWWEGYWVKLRNGEKDWDEMIYLNKNRMFPSPPITMNITKPDPKIITVELKPMKGISQNELRRFFIPEPAWTLEKIEENKLKLSEDGGTGEYIKVEE